MQNLNTEWLLLRIYRPPCEKDIYFLEEIPNVINIGSQTMRNMIVIEDFKILT